MEPAASVAITVGTAADIKVCNWRCQTALKRQAGWLSAASGMQARFTQQGPQATRCICVQALPSQMLFCSGSSGPLGAYQAGLLACAVLLAVLPFRQTEQLNAFSRFIGAQQSISE